MTKVLYLYDEITPALAKDFVAQMAKLRPDEPVIVAVNSPGGSVPAGDAIALALDRHRGPTTARIDALAASAASFVCCFADRVVAARGSFFMFHEPHVSMTGARADDLEGAAATLRSITSRYAATYSARSGQPESEIRRLMALETWLTAEQATQVGFVDELDVELALARKVAPLALSYRNTPSEIRAMAGARPNFDPDAARRKAQRRRLAIIAQQHRAQTDGLRDTDAEIGARVRRRQEMRAVIDRGRADDVRRDAEERAAAKRRLTRDWHYDRTNTPHCQRRYD